MTCTLCIKHKKHNALTKCNTNFRTSTLSRHANGTDHQAAVAADLMAGGMDEVVRKVMHHKEASVIVALKAAIWITKEDISIHKFDKLISLLESLDCPNVAALKTENNHISIGQISSGIYCHFSHCGSR